MSFVYPSFLYALSAIAIPVIIHLFNFRKFQTIYFSNVGFLKDLQQQTQSELKLKQLLVLAARILTITFLVLAFAQPFISSKFTTPVGESVISVFVDNSFSMEAINKNGTLLDEAKKRAHEIANHYKSSDRFQLLTGDFEARHQRLVNKTEFNELVDEIKISSSTKKLSDILLRQTETLNDVSSNIKQGNKIAYIISDFQKSIADIPQLKKDSALTVFFVPVTATERNNVYIDTCWFESPVHRFNQIENLHVRIKNNSDKPLENNSIKLFIDNVQKTPSSFSVDKDASTEIVFSFLSKEEPASSTNYKNTLLQQCRIELNDYPVTFDDKFYFSFEITKNIPVLCINKDDKSVDNVYLNKLFSTDSVFVLKNVTENKLDYSGFLNYTLIVLNELKTISSGLSQELKRFMDNGGSVLVIPDSQIDFDSYKTFTSTSTTDYYERLDTSKTKVDKINIEHMIYKDVFDKKNYSATNLDLPIVSKHYVISKNTKSNGEYLLKLQNGDAFMNEYMVGKGKMYLSSITLTPDFSNFTKHALFVPTIYKIGIYSKSSSPLFYTIGNDETIEYNGTATNENVYHIKDNNSNFDFIPEQKIINSKVELLEHNQIKTTGNYNLLSDKAIITGFSFDYNRKESDLKCYTGKQLNELLISNGINIINLLQNETKSLNETLSEINQGEKLWKICIILALVFLATEILLLRFMKEQKTG